MDAWQNSLITPGINFGAANGILKQAGDGDAASGKALLPLEGGVEAGFEWENYTIAADVWWFFIQPKTAKL